MQEELIERLRSEVKSKLDFEVGTVVKFDSVSRNRGLEMVYNYCAIFASDKRWYLSGKSKYYGDGLTTNDFLEVLRNTDVQNVQVAADWVEL